MIAAVVAGYDLGRRVMEAAGGYDAHNGAGWHSTGTCGVFAAAVAVARLWRLSAAQTRHALGIAGSYSSGNWSFLADGAMTKRLHPGHAAASGLMAAGLARAGMTGPAAVFESEWGGFLATYGGAAADPAALTAGLGAAWRIHRSSIKPYASCRGTHAAVEAALALRGAHAGRRHRHRRGRRAPDHRAHVRRHPRGLAGGCADEPALRRRRRLGCKAMPACRASAPEVRGDPRTLDWLGRVRVVHDPSVPSNIAARVTAIPPPGRGGDKPGGHSARLLEPSAARRRAAGQIPRPDRPGAGGRRQRRLCKQAVMGLGGGTAIQLQTLLTTNPPDTETTLP